jgi:hypothetical protein
VYHVEEMVDCKELMMLQLLYCIQLRCMVSKVYLAYVLNPSTLAGQVQFGEGCTERPGCEGISKVPQVHDVTDG